MSKQFQKQIEDFVCEYCGIHVRGNGYTNHCPQCLWSKHVDINPGDRQEPCCGMMEPYSLEYIGGKYSIIHKCTVCGVRKKNKAQENDTIEILLQS